LSNIDFLRILMTCIFTATWSSSRLWKMLAQTNSCKSTLHTFGWCISPSYDYKNVYACIL